jgi:hypothetical protein
MTKKVHLLSCGPSVFETWSPGLAKDGEPIVGINSICDWFDVDWLCMRDPIVSERLSTAIKPRTGIARGRAIPRECGVQYEWLGNWRHCRFTFPLALRWALLKWPNATVNVYGCDMNQEQGACIDNGRHGAERWQAERRHLDVLIEMFNDRIKFL